MTLCPCPSRPLVLTSFTNWLQNDTQQNELTIPQPTKPTSNAKSAIDCTSFTSDMLGMLFFIRPKSRRMHQLRNISFNQSLPKAYEEQIYK